jgi:uroporphyrinogen decarboxylase
MQTAIATRLQTRNFSLKAASSAHEAAPQTASSSADPLLLRALRGEKVERPPVWMMRQAGRYMKVYQDMCKVHKTFRERSENADLAVEVSLQPWRAFQPDGVILFSDILTPITGMNIPFDILASKGPVIFDPIRTQKQVDEVTELVRVNEWDHHHHVVSLYTRCCPGTVGLGRSVVVFSFNIRHSPPITLPRLPLT